MPADAAPGTTVRPASPIASVVVERPPPGLARGRDPGPSWLLALLGGFALLIVVGYYLGKLLAKRSP